MVQGGSKAKRLSLVNHTAKTIIMSIYFDLTIPEKRDEYFTQKFFKSSGFQGKLKFKSDKWVATV